MMVILTSFSQSIWIATSSLHHPGAASAPTDKISSIAFKPLAA